MLEDPNHFRFKIDKKRVTPIVGKDGAVTRSERNTTPKPDTEDDGIEHGSYCSPASASVATSEAFVFSGNKQGIDFQLAYTTLIREHLRIHGLT